MAGGQLYLVVSPTMSDTEPLAIESTAAWTKVRENGQRTVSLYPSRLRSIQTIERMEHLLFNDVHGSAYRLAKALNMPNKSLYWQWKVGKPRISSRYAIDMVHLALDALEAERAKH